VVTLFTCYVNPPVFSYLTTPLNSNPRSRSWNFLKDSFRTKREKVCSLNTVECVLVNNIHIHSSPQSDEVQL